MEVVENEPEEGSVTLNELGLLVREIWLALPDSSLLITDEIVTLVPVVTWVVGPLVVTSVMVNARAKGASSNARKTATILEFIFATISIFTHSGFSD